MTQVDATVTPVEVQTPGFPQLFQYFDFAGNNNKFWKVSAWGVGPTYRVLVEWGAVGSKGQSKSFNHTMDQINKKIAEKLKKGYKSVLLDTAKIEVVSTDADPVQQVDARVHQVITWILAEAGKGISEYLNTTVDQLGLGQIEKGRQTLQQISRAIQTASTQNLLYASVKDLVALYYQTIPTKLPRPLNMQREIQTLLQPGGLQTQQDRLDQLASAIGTHTIQRMGGSLTQQLGGAMLTPIEQIAPEYGKIVDYITTSAVHGYTPRVKQIFTVEIPNERQRYQASKRGKDQVKQLFHGTRGEYVASILGTGLMCPKYAANGRMFGDGIYFADQSTKSTNYCSVKGAGTPKMLFLADVAVGKMYEAYSSMSHLKKAPAGYDCVWGVGRSQGRSRASLMYNEYIVYECDQQSITHLVLFE